MNTHTVNTHTVNTQSMLWRPGSIRGFGVLLKGSSVVVLMVERVLYIYSPPHRQSLPDRDSNPHPLDNESDSLTIRPRLPLNKHLKWLHATLLVVCSTHYCSKVWGQYLLFSKDALNWSKVTVKIHNVTKIPISNKCCSFERSIHQRIVKNKTYHSLFIRVDMKQHNCFQHWW